MACRRCSTCGIDYSSAKIGACVVCDGALNFFADIEPHSDEEIAERIARAVWQSTGEFRMYGGATKTGLFEKTLDSIHGVDDFLTECGDWPAPRGNE